MTGERPLSLVPDIAALSDDAEATDIAEHDEPPHLTGDRRVDAALAEFERVPDQDLDALVEHGERLRRQLQDRLGDLDGDG